MKPILFNTEMVRAIRDGRKTETRRVIKDALGAYAAYPVDMYGNGETTAWNFVYGKGADMYWTVKQPYQIGDILYVRETWQKIKTGKDDNWRWEYRADCEDERFFSDGFMAEWRPSIHMPKEAARIFLRATDIRAERLQRITMSGMQNEGAIPASVTGGSWQQWQHDYMKPLWDSTIRPKDLYKYGWEANPWVWVIIFERLREIQ